MNIYSLNTEIIQDSPNVSLDRKARHKLLRRSDILHAAEHIFALKGFHKATIQDIARQAEYATGTVYLYFEDKNSLYFSIFEEKIKQLLHILKLKTSQEKKVQDKLKVFIFECLQFFESNQDFFRIFVQEEGRWSIRSKLEKSAVMLKRKNFFVEIIKEAQGQGTIRKDADPEQVSDILESIISSFIFTWCESRPQEKRDLKAMAGIIMDLFLNGVKNR